MRYHLSPADDEFDDFGYEDEHVDLDAELAEYEDSDDDLIDLTPIRVATPAVNEIVAVESVIEIMLPLPPPELVELPTIAATAESPALRKPAAKATIPVLVKAAKKANPAAPKPAKKATKAPAKKLVSKAVPRAGKKVPAKKLAVKKSAVNKTRVHQSAVKNITKRPPRKQAVRPLKKAAKAAKKAVKQPAKKATKRRR